VADHGSTLHLCVGYSVALDLPAAGRCESEREYEMETGAVDARAVPLLHGIALNERFRSCAAGKLYAAISGLLTRRFVSVQRLSHKTLVA